MNKSSKKIDFSIVEQKVDPMDIFVNMSECDFRPPPQQDESIAVQKKLSETSGGCGNCKVYEKKYLKSEAKFMKALDRMQKI